MADFFDDLLKKIFPNREGNPPLSVKENFLLKEKDLHELEEWNKSEESKALFALVYRNYHYKRAQINDTPEVHVFSFGLCEWLCTKLQPGGRYEFFFLTFLGIK